MPCRSSYFDDHLMFNVHENVNEVSVVYNDDLGSLLRCACHWVCTAHFLRTTFS